MSDTNPTPENTQTPEENNKPAIQHKRKFSFFEPIAGIILAIVATVVFFFFPQIISVVFVNGPLIPTFVDFIINGLWFPIFAWAILRIGVEVFYLIERRYTKRLAVVTVIGNVLAFICTLFIFVPYRVVNLHYVEWIYSYFSGGAAWFGEILARPNLIIIIIMLIGLLLDSFTVIRKGRREMEREEEEKAATPTEAASNEGSV